MDIKSIPLMVLMTLSLIGCSDKAVYTSQASVQQRYSDKTIKAADISVDGELTLWSDNDQVCLWDNHANIQRYCVQSLDAKLIEILGISASKKYFYTSNRVNVHLYDLVTGRLITVWSAGDNIINDIAMASNESAIIFGFRSGQSSIVSVKNNTIKTYSPHRLDINSVAISPDGMKALTGSSDKFATIWNTQTGKIIQQRDHQTRVNHVAWAENTKIAVSLDAIKSRSFWLTSSGQKYAKLDSHVKFMEFNDSTFGNNNAWLLSGSPKRKLQLWRVRDGALLGQWQVAAAEGRIRSSVLAVNITTPNKIASFTSDGIFQSWPVSLTKQ